MDKTSFFWTGLCGICHPGGGPGEYDRDGHLYHDPVSGKFGYQVANKVPSAYDGDYALLNPGTGQVGPAPWDKTGVSEPDCLLCHRRDRAIDGEKNLNWIWRTATLRGGAQLVDAQGATVPAYAAAATAGQGWFDKLTMLPVPAGKPPQAGALQINYRTGITRGELYADAAGEVRLAGSHIVAAPRDHACWGCHATPDLKKRGRSWFKADSDVHYAAFNKLRDNDPANDVPAAESTACTVCHPSGMDHNISKGNALLGSAQNSTDYAGIRTCQDCHDATGKDRDPAAPPPTTRIHTEPAHQRSMACQFCHIPSRGPAADLVIDNATTGSTITYQTSAFLSANPLDPKDPDKSRWYPSFAAKKGKDGRELWFPVKPLLSIWWGDWDDRGTASKADDVIAPIALWRVRQITSGQPLEGVVDDDGDSIAEVNTLAEIALYLDALQANDSYGTPVAKRPVLVKGGRVYFGSSDAPAGVDSFEYHHTGIKTESKHPFSIDHNVYPAKQALGANGCTECHRVGMPTAPVFDRLVLVDACDENGKPVYKTVRELTQLNPR